MKIEIRERAFFEVRKGEKREKELMRTTRIIFIIPRGCPAEQPPVSAQFLTADNVLVLYFEDMEEGKNAMTREQAAAIVNFVCTEDPRPVFVCCTADISCSGAVGSVLNWYCNCYLRDDKAAYMMFQICHGNIVPDMHVRRLLLQELENRHGSLETMQQTIERREARGKLVGTLAAAAAEKLLYPRLEKWFSNFDCLRYSIGAVSGEPEALRLAESKFLRMGCGITRRCDMILVVDIEGNGAMRKVFAQMLAMAVPEKHEFKGSDAGSFFDPFRSAIRARIRVHGEYVLKLLENTPKDAAIYLLAERTWRSAGMFGKMGIAHQAKKFDELFNSRNPA